MLVRSSSDPPAHDAVYEAICPSPSRHSYPKIYYLVFRESWLPAPWPLNLLQGKNLGCVHPQPRIQECWNLRTLLQSQQSVHVVTVQPLTIPPQATFMLTARPTSQRVVLGRAHGPSTFRSTWQWALLQRSERPTSELWRTQVWSDRTQPRGIWAWLSVRTGSGGLRLPIFSELELRGLTLQVVTKSCVCSGWFLARPHF